MVRIVFYGPLADIMGRERAVSMSAETTVRQMMESLCGEDAEFKAAIARARVQFAVNDVIGPADAPVKDGDEIAVLPPFSGG